MKTLISLLAICFVTQAAVAAQKGECEIRMVEQNGMFNVFIDNVAQYRDPVLEATVGQGLMNMPVAARWQEALVKKGACTLQQTLPECSLIVKDSGYFDVKQGNIVSKPEGVMSAPGAKSLRDIMIDGGACVKATTLPLCHVEKYPNGFYEVLWADKVIGRRQAKENETITNGTLAEPAAQELLNIYVASEACTK